MAFSYLHSFILHKATVIAHSIRIEHTTIVTISARQNCLFPLYRWDRNVGYYIINSYAHIIYTWNLALIFAIITTFRPLRSLAFTKYLSIRLTFSEFRTFYLIYGLGEAKFALTVLLVFLMKQFI